MDNTHWAVACFLVATGISIAAIVAERGRSRTSWILLALSAGFLFYAAARLG